MSGPPDASHRWVVVGNTANRRVTLFLAAAAELGVEAVAVDWKDVVRDAGVLDRPGPFTLRLDAPGEDDALADGLRARGYGAVAGLPCERVTRPALPGEVLAPRQLHAGLLAVLDDIGRVVGGRADIVLQQPLDTVRLCFDKPACNGLLAGSGVPVPRAVPVSGREELLERAAGQVLWVKLASGSSASGVGVLVQGGRVLMTTVREEDGRRFNAFRIQRLEGGARNRVLDWLLAEGAQVEEDVRRPRLDGAFFDLRVLVVEGVPRFAVVRQARHPITNLHLGGWRGDPGTLADRLGADGLATLDGVCRDVARVLPAGHLGVDVAVRTGFRDVAVLEVNAFGDLLPGLRVAWRDGAGTRWLDVPGAEIAARLPNQGDRVLCSPCAGLSR